MPSTNITDEARQWYNLLPQPIWIFERETLAIKWANDAASGLVGYSTDELARMNISDIHPEEGRAAVRDAVQQLISTEQEAGVWTLITNQGAEVDVAAQWRQITFNGVPAVLSIIRDVTQLTSAQGQTTVRARAAERLLGLGRWEYDIERQSLSWSDRTFELYGIGKDQPFADYDSYMRLIHPADREDVIAAYRSFALGGAPFIEFQHRVVRQDGSTVYVKGIGERFRSGGRDMVVGVVQDVTSLVLSHRRLNEVESLLKLAGDHAKFGAWQVDLETDRVTWTDQVSRIHGMLPGFSPSVDEGVSFYAPEYQDVIRQAYERCRQTGQEFEVVCQIVTAQGERVWVRLMGSAVLDEAGAVVSVLGAFQDISALQDAEDRALHADRERGRILESISDAFFALDRDCRFTYLNPHAEDLLERRSEGLLGKVIWDEFPAASGSNFQVQYEKVLLTGESARFEEYFEPLGRWFHITAFPMPQGVSVYFKDITEERKRTEHLRLLDAAVSRQNDILLITEAEPVGPNAGGPKIIYVNEAFTRRTGYTREEALGKTPRILQGPRTDRQELARIRNALESWQPVRAELVNYTKSGEAFDLELDIVPLADETGRYTHWVAVERDITDRKRAEEALHVSEERFRLVSLATNDVIRDWNFRTGDMWWNEAMASAFGYPLGETEMSPDVWINRIHPEDREAILKQMRAVIYGTGDRWSYEYRFMRSDGSVAIVYDRAFILRDAEGDAIRILGSMSDLSEQRGLEQRLRESQKLEAVGQLTGGVAHDFNNLLTVILGNAEELSQRLTDDQQLRFMAEMTATAAERGAELTNRLLAFARRQALEPKISDLNRLIQGMEGLFRRTLSEDIDIEFVRCAGLWMTEIDHGQLEVALLNLMVNARDAMPAGGRLTIETANVRLDDHYAAQHTEVEAGQYVMVSVSDSGIGMDEQTATRAVEPFFTTKEVGRGSGLGLSMVFGFVKQSRGHIKIYSEVGEGTAIKLYFPRSHYIGPADEVMVEAEKIIGGPEHILVVEDDDLVREHLSTQLKGLGYRVTQAENGPQAIEILRKLEGIDLLLTDVVMPGGINGRELAEITRKARPEIRILFTSGYTENAIVHNGRLDPRVELLSKPYRRRELAAKVRKVLDGEP